MGSGSDEKGKCGYDEMYKIQEAESWARAVWTVVDSRGEEPNKGQKLVNRTG